MSQTGFAFVDGDPRYAIESATARHWAVCAALAIAAQWLLGRASDITNFVVRIGAASWFTVFDGDAIIALSTLAWLIIPYGALAILVWYLSKSHDRRGWRALGLSSRALTGALPWVLAGLFASIPLMAPLVMLPPGWIAPTLEALVWLAPATLIQSGAEEILFRSALLAMLVARYGATTGVLISAVFFALWHVFSGQGLVDLAVVVSTTFVFGVTSAILVLHQGHLGGAIALHFVWNLTNGVHAGTAQLDNFSIGAGFWQSYINNSFPQWTLEALQDTAQRSGLIFPLLLESLIILAACRETTNKLFAMHTAGRERASGS